MSIAEQVHYHNCIFKWLHTFTLERERERENFDCIQLKCLMIDPSYQVDWVIREATSVDNLSKMYEGWTAWI
jgi:hypothetical protein